MATVLGLNPKGLGASGFGVQGLMFRAPGLIFIVEGSGFN